MITAKAWFHRMDCMSHFRHKVTEQVTLRRASSPAIRTLSTGTTIAKSNTEASSAPTSSSSPSSSSPLFQTVLIANRGEIAERVLRTCRRLGISTAAVYSTADAHAPFVQAADQAVCIGPPPANLSYLNPAAILEAVRQTGADAVHPGYGFLSENADFADAIAQQQVSTQDCIPNCNKNVAWLGPPGLAIRQLGDKLQSKQLAEEAGVPTVPGHADVLESLEQALALVHDNNHASSSVAGGLKYPVLLKAAAGGGGKGMRVCYNDADLKEAWVVTKAEGLQFFADDRLLLEQFIERPHHIEFQVIAGGSGQDDIVVFPERECSIQRRNQKIIEETPSVLLTEKTRYAMADHVRRLCQTVQYQSAGTVEFLVDEQQNWYFLEMNTRLQVEHPVTEAITGMDLVEAMLYVGAGRGLPEALQQYAKVGTIVPHAGHAIEARIYAEDPLRGFLPSTGPLLTYVEPATSVVTSDFVSTPPPYVRVDSGVRPGHIVSSYYDPMLSKLIYYGDTREAAIQGLAHALDEYVIQGVRHNCPLVQSVLREPDFVEGATPTSFLSTHYPDGFTGVVLDGSEEQEFAVVAAVIHTARERLLQLAPLAGGDDSTAASVIVGLGGQFNSLAFRVTLGDGAATVERLSDEGASIGDSTRTVAIDTPLKYDALHCLASIGLDGMARTIQVLGDKLTGEIRLQFHGAEMEVLVQSPREYELSLRYMQKPMKVDTSAMVLSPMPGLLISYAAQEGDDVLEGQELCIVESMKMQNMIKSPRSGTIAACKASVGDSLKVDEIILTFE